MKIIYYIIIFLWIPLFPLHTYPKEFGPFNTTLVKKETKKIDAPSYFSSTPSWIFQLFLRTFQIYISPQDGPNCRYTPTCSRYAAIAINDYGPLLGIIMSSDRYLRCNPFGAWGRDWPSDNYFFKNK